MLFRENKWKRILPFAGTVCFGCVLLSRKQFRDPAADLFFIACYFAAVYVLYGREPAADHAKRVKAGCVIFALLFSAGLLIKSHVVFTGEVADSYHKNYFIPLDWTDFFGLIIRFIAVCLPVLIIVPRAPGFFRFSATKLAALSEKSPEKRTCPRISGAAFFLLMFALLIIPWFIGFLHHFPGNIIYADVTYILRADPVKASNVSPVWFNYFVCFFLNKGILSGHPNGGTAVFCLFQMTVFALISAYMLLWMRKKGAGVFLIFPAYLFYAFYPIISLYSFSILKDAWFSYVMLLWVPFLFDAVIEREFTGKRCAALILLIFLTMVFRNNGILVAVLMVPVLTLLFRNKRVPVFLIGACTVILTLCGSASLSRGIVHKFAENVGIPLQQIGMVMTHEDGKMTEREREFFTRILPEDGWTGDERAGSYAPMCVDSVKYNAAGKFDDRFLNAHRKDFVRSWLGILFRNPVLCVRAWLMSTYGFWAFGTVNNVQAFAFDIEENEFGIFQHSLLPEKADALLTRIYSYVPDSEGSAGSFIWLYLFVCLIFLLNHKGGFALVFLPVILNWLTLMAAAPIAFAFRYVYYYLLILPLVFPILMFVFCPSGKEAN